MRDVQQNIYVAVAYLQRPHGLEQITPGPAHNHRAVKREIAPNIDDFTFFLSAFPFENTENVRTVALLGRL